MRLTKIPDLAEFVGSRNFRVLWTIVPLTVRFIQQFHSLPLHTHRGDLSQRIVVVVPHTQCETEAIRIDRQNVKKSGQSCLHREITVNLF